MYISITALPIGMPGMSVARTLGDEIGFEFQNTTEYKNKLLANSFVIL